MNRPTTAFKQVCATAGYNVLLTKNVQTPEEGLEDIIRNYYCRSELVVSTRLHGAITAYGLGIPYLALPGDEKVREFQRLFGGGHLFNDMDALATLLGETHAALNSARPERNSCLRRARPPSTGGIQLVGEYRVNPLFHLLDSQG